MNSEEEASGSENDNPFSPPQTHHTNDPSNEDKYLVRETCLELQVKAISENCSDEGFLNSVSEYYNDAITEFKTVLKFVDSVAATLVMRGPKDCKIITLTIRFIHNGKLECQTLSAAEVDGKATSENIAKTIKQVLQEQWNILDKVVCITTNNESKLKKAVTDCLEIPHKSCVIYTLSLAMQDCLEKIKTTYKFPQKSTKFKTKGPFNWLNTYHDMQYAYDMSTNRKGEFTDTECQELSECIDILKYLKELTNILCKKPYSGLSSIIPLFDSLQQKLEKYTPSTIMGKDFKEKVVNAIIHRFGKYELGTSRFRLSNFGNALFIKQLMTEKSTFLDPRFKKAGFATMNDADSVQDDLYKEIRKLQYPDLDGEAENLRHAFEKKVKIRDSADSGRNNGAGSEPEELLAEEGRRNRVPRNEVVNLWDTLDGKVEVTHYAQLPYLMRSEDPFKFWEEKKQDYKILYKLSLKYLCIPATLIYSEETLSEKAENLRKNVKHVQVVDQILFLHSYYSRAK